MELTAELASDPSPEHQEVSTNRLICTMRYETINGRVMDRMAFLGSPNMDSRSFVVFICPYLRRGVLLNAYLSHLM